MIYLESNDSHVIDQEKIRQSIRNAWETENRRTLQQLSWNIRIVNVTSGYVSSTGTPVVAVYYTVALPSGREVMSTLREPSFGSQSRRIQNVGYTNIFPGLVYSPEYYVTNIVKGANLSPLQVTERLMNVWQAVFRSSNLQVFPVTVSGATTPGGQPATQVVYFMVVNGQFLHQNSIRSSLWDRGVDLLLDNVESREVNLPHSVNIGLLLNRAAVNRDKIQEAIIRAWTEANPGKH